MRRILKLGAALDDGMLLALLSLYVFKCNEVSVLYTVCLRRLRRLRRLSALCCARRAATPPPRARTLYFYNELVEQQGKPCSLLDGAPLTD